MKEGGEGNERKEQRTKERGEGNQRISAVTVILYLI
jgi:hypothetical protein